MGCKKEFQEVSDPSADAETVAAALDSPRTPVAKRARSADAWAHDGAQAAACAARVHRSPAVALGRAGGKCVSCKQYCFQCTLFNHTDVNSKDFFAGSNPECTACKGTCPPREFWIGRKKSRKVFTEDKAQARGEFWTALGTDSAGEPAYEIGVRNRASEQNKRIRFLWLRNKGHKAARLDNYARPTRERRAGEASCPTSHSSPAQTSSADTMGDLSTDELSSGNIYVEQLGVFDLDMEDVLLELMEETQHTRRLDTQAPDNAESPNVHPETDLPMLREAAWLTPGDEAGAMLTCSEVDVLTPPMTPSHTRTRPERLPLVMLVDTEHLFPFMSSAPRKAELAHLGQTEAIVRWVEQQSAVATATKGLSAFGARGESPAPLVMLVEAEHLFTFLRSAPGKTELADTSQASAIFQWVEQQSAVATAMKGLPLSSTSAPRGAPAQESPMPTADACTT